MQIYLRYLKFKTLCSNDLLKAESDILCIVHIGYGYLCLHTECTNPFIHLVIFCSQYFNFLQQIEMGHLGAGTASVLVFAVYL